MSNFLDTGDVSNDLLDRVDTAIEGIDDNLVPYRSHGSPLVVTNGEMDFHPGRTPGEIYSDLRDRSEQVGALVRHRPAAGEIHVRPWGGGCYTLHYPADLGAGHPYARIESVTVTDERTESTATLAMPEIIAHGVYRDELFAALNPDTDD